MCDVNLKVNKMSLFIGLSIFLAIVSPGLCIECYRCNSTNNLDCLEKFMYPNPMQAESCNDVFEAKYCIKTTSIYEDVLGTQRFCSNIDMGDKCEFITHNGIEYKGCVYTCHTDGCNAAPSTSAISAALVTLTSILVIFGLL